MAKRLSYKKYFAMILVLSVLGMVLSSLATIERNNYLADESYDSSICVEGDYASCGNVLTSDFSTLFGIPVSSIGFMGYLLVFLLAIFALFNLKDDFITVYFDILYFLSFVMLFTTFGFAYISAFVLNKFCTLCVLMYFVNIAIFVVSFVFNAIKMTKEA